MYYGNLDNFSTQEKVNLFEEDYLSSIKIAEYDFIPNIKVQLINSNEQGVKEIMEHPSGEAF